MSKQQLHHILTNPFYAGKIRHKMLGEELVDGIQPKVISFDDFLRVQEILSNRTGIYKHKKETPRFPLKRHVLCAKDHTPFTAYTVKKKNIDYYKCNQDGCKTNVSAKTLHYRYEHLLRSFSIPKVLAPLLYDVISCVMIGNKEERKKYETILKKHKTEYQKKLQDCKVRFGMGDIDKDVYTATVESLQEKLNNIEIELEECKKDLSNHTEDIEKIVSICCKLDSLWKESSLETSQKLQHLLFPNGVLWDKEIGDYRTFDENKALAVISKISTICEKEKEEISKEKSSLVKLCA
jgi:hypothetical protein